ncbi:LuxR C-terminal-related transcriptional regulator [Rhodococcus rhodochrous]|uniref:LuxR C-terminal-related transcriptional regulator n=1 Tax=Rhodococcus rhodochrous TaxID=1829 RepID=UPI003557D557
MQLTSRERPSLNLVAEDLTDESIASRLVVSPRTVQGHVALILPRQGFTPLCR